MWVIGAYPHFLHVGQGGGVGLHSPGKLIGQPLQVPSSRHWETRKEMGAFPTGPELLEGEVGIIHDLNNHKNRTAGGPTVCQEICTYNHI